MKEFIIFGDYRDCAVGTREDFKIFDFVVAETAAHAFALWRQSVRQEIRDVEKAVEEQVYVMETEGTRWVFDLATGAPCQRYRRTDSA